MIRVALFALPIAAAIVVLGDFVETVATSSFEVRKSVSEEVYVFWKYFDWLEKLEKYTQEILKIIK